MMNFYKILLPLLTALFLISCKDSDTVSPSASEPVLIFSKDSLGLSSSDTIIFLGLADSVLYSIDSSVKKIKLDYFMESSGGGSYDRVYYGVFISKQGTSLYSDYGYLFASKTIDTSKTFDITNFKGLTLKFKVAMEKKYDFSYRYVTFKRMKLWKVE